ncbi:SUMO ligase siz1, partial [Ascosphaera atra]
YVDNILKTTNSEVEQVVVEPNGEWYVQGEGGPDRQASTPAMGENDDIVEITEDRPMQAKEEEQPSGTPANLSRIPQQSSTPIPTPSGSTAKRKHEVIDLTLSDEDEDPPRPPKRVFHRLTLHSPAYQSPYRPNDLQSRFDPDNPTNGYGAHYEPTGHSFGASGQNPGQFT